MPPPPRAWSRRSSTRPATGPPASKTQSRNRGISTLCPARHRQHSEFSGASAPGSSSPAQAETAAALAAREQVGATANARLPNTGSAAGASNSRRVRRLLRLSSAPIATPAPYDFHGLGSRRHLGSRQPLGTTYRDRKRTRPIDWEVIATLAPGRSEERLAPFRTDCRLRPRPHRTRRQGRPRRRSSPRQTAPAPAHPRNSSARPPPAPVSPASPPLAVGLHRRESPRTNTSRDLLRVAYPIGFGRTARSPPRPAARASAFSLAALVTKESFWDPSAGSAIGRRASTSPRSSPLPARVSPPRSAWPRSRRPTSSARRSPSSSGPITSPAGGTFWRPAPSPPTTRAGNAIRWSNTERAADTVESIDYNETKHVTYIVEAYAHQRTRRGSRRRFDR